MTQFLVEFVPLLRILVQLLRLLSHQRAHRLDDQTNLVWLSIPFISYNFPTIFLAKLLVSKSLKHFFSKSKIPFNAHSNSDAWIGDFAWLVISGTASLNVNFLSFWQVIRILFQVLSILVLYLKVNTTRAEEKYSESSWAKVLYES